MQVVFITHNELGLACLEELDLLDADIQAIYTRPQQDDISDQTSFEEFTARTDADLHRVSSVNSDEVKAQLRGYEPELLFVVGWSRLVDSEVIDMASTASLGMHPAPLPRGRGRAPIAWTLIKGLEKTQLSFFHLAEEADAGDLVGQQSIAIAKTDDAQRLYEKTVQAGRKLIREYYPEFESGTVPATPQNEDRATWWPKREPHHGLIDWRQSQMAIYNWIRGQTRPYPGAFSYLNGRKVIIWSAHVPNRETTYVEPGEIRGIDDQAVSIGTWEGSIEVTEIQVGDDPPRPGAALCREYPFEVGDVFEDARDRLG